MTDAEAFAQLYDRHFHKLLAYFYRRTADAETAFDLTAETFAKAFAERRRYRRNRGQVLPWLYGIARNELSAMLRRRRVDDRARRRLGIPRVELDDVALARVEELVDFQPLREEVRAALGTMPPPAGRGRDVADWNGASLRRGRPAARMLRGRGASARRPRAANAVRGAGGMMTSHLGPPQDELRAALIERGRQAIDRDVRRRARARKAASVGLGMTVGVFLLVGAIFLVDRERPDPVATKGGPVVRPSGLEGRASPLTERTRLRLLQNRTPLIRGGRETALQDAAVVAPHPLYRPGALGAPSAVWIQEENIRRRSGTGVALRYSDRLVVLYNAAILAGNSTETYQRLSQESDIGYATQVAGHPAWVVAPADVMDVAGVFEVHVAIGDVEVLLIGQGDRNTWVELVSDLDG